MISKTFTNVKESFFAHLRDEASSTFDEVEEVLIFHDVRFHFSWLDNKLTLELNVLPPTFSGNEILAWDLIKQFIETHGGVEV